MYHDPECRERMAAIRAEERKVERALELADMEGTGHKDRLPSAYLDKDVTRQGKVLADIRFEMDQDPAAGTTDTFTARVRGVAGAAKAVREAAGSPGEPRDGLYGALILIAAAAASWAIHLDAPVSRFKRPIRRLRSAT